MPARVEEPRAFDPNHGSPLFQHLNLGKPLLKIILIAKDADIVLHCFLQIAMNIVGTISGSACKGRKHFALSFFDLLFIYRSWPRLLCMFRGGYPGASAKHEQIGKRIAS